MRAPYILIFAKGLYYLIPMDRVEEIVSSEDRREEEIPVYPLESLCCMDGEEVQDDYVLLLSSGENRFGIAVERVEELMDLDAADIISLPKAVRSSKNSYLEGVLPMEGREVPAAYVLNDTELYKKAVDTGHAYCI